MRVSPTPNSVDPVSNEGMNSKPFPLNASKIHIVQVLPSVRILEQYSPCHLEPDGREIPEEMLLVTLNLLNINVQILYSLPLTSLNLFTTTSNNLQKLHSLAIQILSKIVTKGPTQFGREYWLQI